MLRAGEGCEQPGVVWCREQRVGCSIIPAGIWEPWAARRTWHFLFFMCSGGGVCPRFLAVVTQGRAGVWEFLFIQAPFPGHPTALQGEIPGRQHLAKPCSFRTGCLARLERGPSSRSCLCPSCPSLPPWQLLLDGNSISPTGSCCHQALRCHFCLIKCESLSSRLRVTKISFPIVGNASKPPCSF